MSLDSPGFGVGHNDRTGRHAQGFDEWRFRTLVALRERRPDLAVLVLAGRVSLRDAADRLDKG
jgi:hypothetical protein